jgi:hypothetical protein
MGKIGNKIKKMSTAISLAILSLAFFFGTASYNYLVQSPDWIKFSAPDEAANYLFSKVYHDTSKLEIYEKYNIPVADIIHPRSLRSDLGFMKPVSFPGIILLYGTLAKALGVAILPFLTPLFAALALLPFYFLVRAIFDKRTALFSSIILAFFPVYIYYSARSFFHNVLFIDLLISGLCLAVYSVKLSSREYKGAKALSLPPRFVWITDAMSAIAGIFIGYSLATRLAEAIWVIPLLLFLAAFNLRRLGWAKISLFITGLFLGLLPLLYWNQILYGSYFASGYSEINRSFQAITQAAGESAIGSASWLAPWQKLKDAIFYFGFKPDHSLKMFYYYFAAMFPWLFAGASIGVSLWLARFKKISRIQWLFFAGWLIAGTFLVLYYGSWKFSDNPDPASHTIGNSYTRYWLPLYMGAIIFLSYAISRLSELSKKWLGKIGKLVSILLPALVIVIIAAWSLRFVLIGSEEGLINTAAKQEQAKVETKTVLAATEGNAVVITQYHDKYLFPERKVIAGLLTDDNMNKYYLFLVKHLPVYYFNFTFPEKDLKYLNNTRLPKSGFVIEPKQAVGKFTLYKLELIKAE